MLGAWTLLLEQLSLGVGQVTFAHATQSDSASVSLVSGRYLTLHATQTDSANVTLGGLGRVAGSATQLDSAALNLGAPGRIAGTASQTDAATATLGALGTIVGSATQSDSASLALSGWALVAGVATQSDTAAATFQHGFVTWLSLHTTQSDSPVASIWPVKISADSWATLALLSTVARSEVCGTSLSPRLVDSVFVRREVHATTFTARIGEIDE